MRKKLLIMLLTVSLAFGFDSSVSFAEPATGTLNQETEEEPENTADTDVTEGSKNSEEPGNTEEPENTTDTEPAKEPADTGVTEEIGETVDTDVTEETGEAGTPEAETKTDGEPENGTKTQAASENSENEPHTVGGVIPDNLPAISIHDENEDTVPAARSVSLPAAYDSRNYGAITAVRNQNPFGTCWTFGALSAGEASLVRKGLAAAGSLDLSERQLAYFFYHSATDPLGNTAGDTTTPLGNDYLNLGGNNLFTTFALAAWTGAAAETAAPYDSLVNLYYQMGLTPSFFTATDLPSGLAYADTYHMQNSYWIPMTDTADVKKMIMEYGALSISYYHADAYLNYSTNAYYFPVATNENHVVSVVGWDDNYSKSNFLSEKQPANNGAWLVKNSWGNSFGDGGYFWISYEDKVLTRNTSKAFVYDFESASNYENNYQYDGSTGVSYASLDSGGNIANVYTAKANPGGSETLEAVSFALYDTNVNYSIQIYTNLTDRTDPTSGTPALSKPVTGKTSYVGYYTVPLGTKVPLRYGSNYSIVIQLSKDSGDSVAYMVDASYTNGSWIQFTSSVSAGQSFRQYSLYSGWQDLSYSGLCARIKGFTNNNSVTLATGITLSKTSLTLNQGTAYALKATVSPAGLSGAKVLWSSSDAKVAAVDANGRVTTKGGGTATITALVNDGSKKSASCKVTVPYTITYKLNGGKNHSGNPSTYFNKKITLKSPSRTGYTFRGWYTDSKYKHKVSSISASSKKNLTLYARWSKNKLAFGKSSYTVKKGKSYTLKVEAMPSGRTISFSSSNKKVATVNSKGKVTAKAIGTATITAKMKDPTGRTLTASCKVTVPYTISYKLNGGKNHSSNPSTYYKKKITLKSPSRSGYFFRGWYADSKYKKRVTSIASSSKKNLTLYARWSKITLDKTSIRSLKNNKAKQAVISYKKVDGSSGYQITYSTSKSFKGKKSITTKGSSAVLKSLKKGKTYYVRVRAYKKDSAGKPVYGQYSATKEIKITR